MGSVNVYFQWWKATPPRAHVTKSHAPWSKKSCLISELNQRKHFMFIVVVSVGNHLEWMYCNTPQVEVKRTKQLLPIPHLYVDYSSVIILLSVIIWINLKRMNKICFLKQYVSYASFKHILLLNCNQNIVILNFPKFNSLGIHKSCSMINIEHEHWRGKWVYK